MFVQVIEGEVSDVAQLRRQMDRWQADVRPGAAGYLGTTAGVTPDGHMVVLARFESAESARANSERAEQDEWWSETKGCFDGDVSFSDTDEVDLFLGGGSNEAGFVQVMKGSGDRATLAGLDERFSTVAATYRPDLLGGVRAWVAPDRYVEAAYFTSEAEARANESKEPPPEVAAEMAQFGELMADVEYVDLKDPWLF